MATSLRVLPRSLPPPLELLHPTSFPPPLPLLWSPPPTHTHSHTHTHTHMHLRAHTLTLCQVLSSRLADYETGLDAFSICFCATLYPGAQPILLSFHILLVSTFIHLCVPNTPPQRPEYRRQVFTTHACAHTHTHTHTHTHLPRYS